MSIDIPEAPTSLTYQEQQKADREALAEDLWFMAKTGETIYGAAKRVDKTIVALEGWCRVHGHMDIWRRLQANAPFLVGKKDRRCS